MVNHVARMDSPASADTQRISPSAHYTSQIWVRNGMSHGCFDTSLGRLLYECLRPLNALVALTCGGLTLERMLLQRHRIIDYLLENALQSGIRQVLEIGAGLSPRGLRLVQKYKAEQLRYVEADLPSMAEQKRRLLTMANLSSAHHTIVDVDVLLDSGALSLAEVAKRHLRVDEPTVVITEGLLGYFDPETVSMIWGRINTVLRAANGVYLSDLHLECETPSNGFVRFYKNTLERLTRGQTHSLLQDVSDARDRLVAAGFSYVDLHRPAELHRQVEIPVLNRPDVLRVLEARN